MQIYTIKKRASKWIIYSGQKVALYFDTYEEALATAVGAAVVVADSRETKRSVPLGRDSNASSAVPLGSSVQP